MTNMILTAALITVLMQTPPASPPPAARPANGPALLEAPRIRPSRAGDARNIYGKEPGAEPDPEATTPEPTPEELEPAAAAPPPVAAPVTEPQRVLPPQAASVVAPGAETIAPNTPAVAAKPGGSGRIGPEAFVALAPLTMLIGPAIGALWFVSRRGVGTTGS